LGVPMYHHWCRGLVLILLGGILASAHVKPESWLQISSQHFSVFCNGSEKQARHIADQLERMRLVFHVGFPDMQVDPAAPIVVIAVKEARDFRLLEPEAYLAKGQLQLAGLFQRTPDKNYVILRMDVGGEHPYATIYHEYTHLMFSRAEEWLPVWLNEGMADFYENTDIRERDTILGQASAEDILRLRQNRLLPLTTLLVVDHNSPYYHEEQKGSIFYAESWALTHYLQVRDAQNDTHKIKDYLVLVSHHVDSVTAASQAFGDLKQLQSDLETYIEQSNFKVFKLTKSLELDVTSFKVQPVTEAQADAVRADFLAYIHREKDARSLLEQVLHDDPNNTLAHETMGYLEFRAGHMEQAQNWYAQAVKLDSQSYLANYYFASIAMSRGESGGNWDGQIENSLQKAIKLNPSFAPSYDRLAVFYGMHHRDLDRARVLLLQAVELDPENVFFRVNAANILSTMQRDTDAINVLQSAMKLAKTPEEVAAVQNALETVQLSRSVRGQEQQQKREREQEEARQFHDDMEASAKQSVGEEAQPRVPKKKEIVLKGPRRSVTGTIKSVHCSAPAVMDLDVDTDSRMITLHTSNYYKVEFSGLGFTPTAELKPCTDLRGVHAKVEYIEASDTKTNGVLAIELHK
jgi:tetratricopeptide (TPR) repeat protein